jgi:hypothetical protein
MFCNYELPPDGVHHGAVPPVCRSKLLLLKWRREKAAIVMKTDVSVSSNNKAEVILHVRDLQIHQMLLYKMILV